jgi:hypothetical protein
MSEPVVLGIRRVFYYIRDEQKRPVITVCLAIADRSEGGQRWDSAHITRGMALCSKKDTPNKRVGRALAWGRARKAIDHIMLGKAKLTEPVTRYIAKPLLTLLDPKYWYFEGDGIGHCLPEVYKSNGSPLLSKWEKEIIRRLDDGAE